MHATQALGTYLQSFLKRVRLVEKIEWLVAYMTLDRAKRAILGVILVGRFLANLGCICGRGETL